MKIVNNKFNRTLKLNKMKKRNKTQIVNNKFNKISKMNLMKEINKNSILKK